jgi:hypothetical protein
MKRWWLPVIFVLFFSVTGFSQNQPPLTKDGLIKMVQAGFDEGTIIQLIKANGSAVDTSVESLLELKKAGVSQNIIRELLGSAPGPNTTPNPASPPSTAAPPSAPPGPGASPTTPQTPAGETEEIGVYVLKDGKFLIVEPEIVTWRTGGVLKTIATVGLTRGHVNGKVNGPRSRLQLSAPLEFLIVGPEGTSAAEYQLLRLQQKEDRREFRAVTGGIVHASGGADKNAVYFEFERVRPRTFRIKLNQMDRGEYGFLAPGAAMSASAASAGKIYTFGLE